MQHLPIIVQQCNVLSVAAASHIALFLTYQQARTQHHSINTFSTWFTTLFRSLSTARVKCRSTQVNKMQVKSCSSKVVAMGILAVGFLPFVQE